VYHASWDDEKIIRGTVATIAQKAREAKIEKTALLIVGQVVDPHNQYRRSHLYS
jgi:precorrin-4/cobalt-precorrin-4 C11-methyltransferase